MSIALCMVIRDEAERITDCLDSALGSVDEVRIIDTGSTDGTPELIEQRYGIPVARGRLDPARCFNLADPINAMIERSDCDWILKLDADERLVAPDGLLRVATRMADDTLGGFFGTWRNHLPGEPVFDDYKLFLFRRDHRKRGLIHENVQIDIREAGGRAEWLSGLRVDHFPDGRRVGAKRLRYCQLLEQAMRLDPDWLRYPWFLGYSRFLDGDPGGAREALGKVRDSHCAAFPVEALNARMVLTEIAARNGDRGEAEALINELNTLHTRLAGDFEVAVNTGLPDWIASTRQLIAHDQLESVRARRFAC